MNENIWTDWRLPRPCPKCHLGELFSINKKFVQTETRESLINALDEPPYPVSGYVFSEHFQSNTCGEAAAALGFVSCNNYPDENGDDMYAKYSTFIPAPHIIVIPKSCPDSVRRILIDSFGLFWMDELKIKKTQVKKRGAKRLSSTIESWNTKKRIPRLQTIF
ncbi:hypothetical protein [Pedobacter sp. R-06]|uniref:hypothetical protein n=1 Tax=Pedobacter sp. R-06 TaxID=3404051 RepID=UPI003CF238A2